MRFHLCGAWRSWRLIFLFATELNHENQFSGYTIEKVEREFWKDRQAYELKLKSNTNSNEVKLLVDANGTILKQKLKD